MRSFFEVGAVTILLIALIGFFGPSCIEDESKIDFIEGAKVYVTKGFYRGAVGVLTNYDERSNSYIIVQDNSGELTKKYITVDFDSLEIIKN